MTTQTSVYQIHEETSTANAVLLGIKTDIDRSILQSQSNNLATRRDMDELKSVVEALVSANFDTTLTLQRLISKPDALRVICGGISNEQPDQRLLPIDKGSEGKAHDESDSLFTDLYCNCNTRRSLNRKTRRSGPAFLSKEVVVDKPHRPGCPLSTSLSEQSKWTAGISAKILHGIVSLALTVTTSTIVGAGGLAISPSFAYFPVRKTSPARDAILLFANAYLAKDWTEQDLKRLVWRTIKTIQTSFTSRRSSPLDVGSTGKTLLHDAMMWSQSWRAPGNQIVNYLVSAGVPTNRPDHRGM